MTTTPTEPPVQPVTVTDTGTVRLVIGLLGAIALGGLGAIVGLSITDHDTNTVGLITTGAAASLATILTTTRSVQAPPQPPPPAPVVGPAPPGV